MYSEEAIGSLLFIQTCMLGGYCRQDNFRTTLPPVDCGPLEGLKHDKTTQHRISGE